MKYNADPYAVSLIRSHVCYDGQGIASVLIVLINVGRVVATSINFRTIIILAFKLSMRLSNPRGTKN